MSTHWSEAPADDDGYESCSFGAKVSPRLGPLGMLWRPAHRPEISPAAVARLAEDGDLCNIDESEVPDHGDPLLQTIASTAPGNEWLQAAVLAGYVPALEGIELALKATREVWLREYRACRKQGVDGDALNTTFLADEYRRLNRLLEELATEMDELALKILGPVTSKHTKWARAEVKRRRASIAHSQRRLGLLEQDDRAYKVQGRAV